ncbi:MAG: PsbP-related protein [Fimbriimonadales bacterium]|nr:PsbP-related protein [Fimbriimonadales bacterium]
MRAVMLWGLLWCWLLPGWGQSLQVYTHPKEGIKISVPPQWKPDTSDPDLLVEFQTPDDTSFYLAISSAPMPLQFPSEANYQGAMTGYFEEFRQGVASELGIRPEQVVELRRQVHQVGKLKVATLDVRAPTQDWVFRARTRFVLADNRLYAITISADEEEFLQKEAMVNQILDSFQPKNPEQGFPMRALWLALGVACAGGVVLTAVILLLVRAFSR